MPATPEKTATGIELITNFELLGPNTSAPIPTRLTYDRSDPYAICAQFHSNGSDEPTVDWYFARDLLGDAVNDPARTEMGDGEVSIKSAIDTYGNEGLIFWLRSIGEERQVWTDFDPMARLAIAMYQEVQPGSESDHIDVGAAIAQINQAAGR